MTVFRSTVLGALANFKVLAGDRRSDGSMVMHVELEALKKRLYRDNKVKNIKFFPGPNGDATPEDLAREINKFFADPSEEEGCQ